jgi:hypothetical protein
MGDHQDMVTYREITNLVVKFFNDDWDKAACWFRLPNPSLGNLSPHALIRMGRINKLAEFVRNAMKANEAARGQK